MSDPPHVSVASTAAQDITAVLQRVSEVLSPDDAPHPLHAPEIDGNAWAYVKDCLDTGWVSSAGR